MGLRVLLPCLLRSAAFQVLFLTALHMSVVLLLVNMCSATFPTHSFIWVFEDTFLLIIPYTLE